MKHVIGLLGSCLALLITTPATAQFGPGMGGNSTYAAHAAPDPIYWMFNCTTKPCIIGNDMGGNIGNFNVAAIAAVKQRRRFEFTGNCDSACVGFADILRKHGLACIRPGARFGVHLTIQVAAQGMNAKSKVRLPSPELNRWVKRNLHRPTDSWGLIYMENNEARRYWKAC